MSRDEFKMTLWDLTELDQRKEMALYDVYEAHINASKDYARDKTPKDMSCSSGRCGDDDTCTPGINSIFNQKKMELGGGGEGAGGYSSGKIVAIVAGVFTSFSFIVLAVIFGLMYRRGGINDFCIWFRRAFQQFTLLGDSSD